MKSRAFRQRIYTDLILHRFTVAVSKLLTQILEGDCLCKVHLEAIEMSYGGFKYSTM